MHCGITARITYVINENESWAELWTKIHNRSSGIAPLPPANFTTELIIAVFQGDCPTGGYMTTIKKIILTSVNYVVFADEIRPHPNSCQTQAFTQPYHIVKISGYSQDFPVQFVYNITTSDYL